MRDILLEAEDSPLSEVNRLMDNCAQDLGVIKSPCVLLLRVLHSDGTEWLVDLRSLKDPGFDAVGLEVDVQVPVLHLFGVGDELVQVLDRGDSFWWLLEE